MSTTQKIKWILDESTKQAAVRWVLPKFHPPVSNQYPGHSFNPKRWNNRLLSPAWSAGKLTNSPEQIIEEFKRERYLQGLVLVASWGGMGRTSRFIWGNRSLEHIERVLNQCANTIKSAQSIDKAWQMMVEKKDDGLGWTPVCASKTLHFLCRSLGFVENPPVPIDQCHEEKDVKRRNFFLERVEVFA